MDFIKYVGPGFLVSMAYLDPGNRKFSLSLYISLSLISFSLNLSFAYLETVETDLQAGANHRYEVRSP